MFQLTEAQKNSDMKLLPAATSHSQNMKHEENWPALDSRGQIVRGIIKRMWQRKELCWEIPLACDVSRVKRKSRCLC